MTEIKKNRASRFLSGTGLREAPIQRAKPEPMVRVVDGKSYALQAAAIKADGVLVLSDLKNTIDVASAPRKKVDITK